MVSGNNWISGWSSTTNDTWYDTTSSTTTNYYIYPSYIQSTPVIKTEMSPAPPPKPKPETALEWLDRRVDEVRMPLAA